MRYFLNMQIHYKDKTSLRVLLASKAYSSSLWDKSVILSTAYHLGLDSLLSSAQGRSLMIMIMGIYIEGSVTLCAWISVKLCHRSSMAGS